MKFVKLDDLQTFCDNQKDHAITPNDFQRMKHYEFGWHTGTPTEEGWYLCAYGDNFYCANYWNGIWRNSWGGTLLAWQKITPYEGEVTNER